MRSPTATTSILLLQRLLLLLLGLGPGIGLGAPAYAWGPAGHRIVGALAEEQLSDSARVASRRLLAGQSLAEASTWADDVRGEPEWAWLTPLHYVNFDPAVGRFQGCPREGCLIEAIEDQLLVLADGGRSAGDRRLALRLVTHLVGDLHQPLHVSHAADRGGNAIEVELLGDDDKLHAVWDSGLLRAQRISWRRKAKELTHRAASTRRSEACVGSIEDWAQESYRLAVEVVYPGAPAGSRLGDDYVARHRERVDERLVLGGVRLGCLLERAFADARSPW
jgi:hypothetical protein